MRATCEALLLHATATCPYPCSLKHARMPAYAHATAPRLKVPDPNGGAGKLVDHGVHAIIVPIRDASTGALLPGVEIRDCGYKVGGWGRMHGCGGVHLSWPACCNVGTRWADAWGSGRHVWLQCWN